MENWDRSGGTRKAVRSGFERGTFYLASARVEVHDGLRARADKQQAGGRLDDTGGGLDHTAMREAD
ncbi:hypothetical protein N7489_003273 [Penicillium chrysogenum]|uniref:Uncharacterized protein n=1 Tax=Penicillium chrysogenum TaxID=5076 RepID=A0ABQ8W828_PENCH|nr:uncharacterized protein N7489_003273 [Penicillium chrysogenum]XP_061069245.1 uncharacterized protein N7525_009670 [Penicillium rubens]KAJ5252863.1 hypothetical protein N7489_003273 [Penicillium chrysogenum]KAJ5253984.1 hypothetical protein N7524_011164 [Penicillium chrysogenum]KAJ5260095.1 hypothetical protein N7505_009476 [Penicillium chrysogenum]KAJ5831417.1 hypothetical protein N7525_009670 [Penicillium rubens]KAJ5854960.1 hypothetical protein N7534_007503 [Penicillium rubens]